MMRVSLSILFSLDSGADPSKNAMISRVRVRDVLQDLLKQKRRCWWKGIVARDIVVRFYQSQWSSALGLQVSFLIFLLVLTSSISNHREVVKLSEEIASLRLDERYEILRILKKFRACPPSLRLRLLMTLGLSVIWTWFCARFDLSKKDKQSN